MDAPAESPAPAAAAKPEPPRKPRFEPVFAPSRISVGTASRPLAFSLEEATIGGKSLLPENRTPTEPRRSGDEVVYAHGAVTEKYLLKGNEVEQIFILDSSLEELRSTGELRLLIALDTTLRASVVEGRALEFQGDGPPLRYGAATAIDATGRSRELSYRLLDRKLEMTLDPEFLAGAAFPLTIDPLIGFAGAISFNLRFPAAAYSPAADYFLIVGEYWIPDIRAVAYSPTASTSPVEVSSLPLSRYFSVTAPCA
jgi:hypothetical protein